MTKYELTYLTVDEEPIDAPSVRDTLVKHEAKIESVNVWTGRRKLAYPIKKQDQAFFTTMVFEADSSAIKPISDALLANEGILRNLIVRYIPQPERGGTGEPLTVEVESPKTQPEDPQIGAAPSAPEVQDEPVKKPKRVTKKATEAEAKALDEKLEELLSEDITA